MLQVSSVCDRQRWGGYPKDQRETESLPHLASYPGSPHSPDSQCLLLLAAEVLPSEGWKGNGEV